MPPNTPLLRNAHRPPAMIGVPAVLTCALAHGRLQPTASRARSLAFWQLCHALAAAERQAVGPPKLRSGSQPLFYTCRIADYATTDDRYLIEDFADMTSQHRLVNHIHDILIKLWDPIGVKDEPQAQDEYDSYIPAILQFLQAQANVEIIASHLYEIETRWMGLTGAHEHAQVIAQFLSATYSTYTQAVALPCYTRVRLITDRYHADNAPCGSVGYIIEIHDDALEVEFSDTHGVTYAQVVVHHDEVIADERVEEE
jgi:hypothetical protein